MKRMILTGLAFSLVAATSVGCATFDSLTPKGAYTEASHGVWLGKSSGFMGIRTASQEVLFCYADIKSQPKCIKAQGDVGAAKTGGEVK